MMDIRDEVKKAYSAAADKPGDKHTFPVGRQFAESIGYPGELLDTIPSSAVMSFTGVSNTSIFADIPVGSTILDLGCGAGLDSFIAAQRTGPEGKVIGIDFSESMIFRARQAFSESGIENVEFHIADAESPPIEDSSIDVALVNGIFNLSPSRESVFHELARSLRDGGSVYAAELILQGPQPPNTHCDLKNWFA
jgi:ubiquinone/menaquinone biosynthesis C-methylase UbiE